MKRILFAASAALALFGATTALANPSVSDLAGNNPRFDYTMLLSPDLLLAESTTASGLMVHERTRRMLEATVFVENSSATSESGSIGSGVIIDNQRCLAVSNHHVVEGADFLNVSFVTGWLPDGEPMVERVSATIVGYPGDKNQGFDLALLQLDHCDGAAWAPISKDHTRMRAGEVAIAAGNPMGQTWTLTTGTISHTARTASGPWLMIQTDASVNKGNSGGPLFDHQGYVIGINTSILSRTAENNGIAFSTRSDLMRLFLNNVYHYGKMQVNRIGVSIGGISAAEATIMDIPGGVLVDEVVEGSPSEAAGIQKGDIITHVNGVLATSKNRIIMTVWAADPAVGAAATIIRTDDDGNTETLNLVIPVEDVWESEYTPPASDAYEGTMGWTLELLEDGRVAITDTAAMSPTHRLGLTPEEISKTLAPKPFPVDGRPRTLRVSIEGASRTIVEGVKAQGVAKLDLANLPHEERIAALEAYIAEAGGAPIVLYLVASTQAEVVAQTVTRQSVELDQSTMDSIMAEEGVNNAENSYVLYAQPKPYTAPVDLENWVPPFQNN